MKEKVLSLFKKNIVVSSGFVFLLFLVIVGGDKVFPSSLGELFAIHKTYADGAFGVPTGTGTCCGCDCGIGGW